MHASVDLRRPGELDARVTARAVRARSTTRAGETGSRSDCSSWRVVVGVAPVSPGKGIPGTPLAETREKQNTLHPPPAPSTRYGVVRQLAGTPAGSRSSLRRKRSGSRGCQPSTRRAPKASVVRTWAKPSREAVALTSGRSDGRRQPRARRSDSKVRPRPRVSRVPPRPPPAARPPRRARPAGTTAARPRRASPPAPRRPAGRRRRLVDRPAQLVPRRQRRVHQRRARPRAATRHSALGNATPSSADASSRNVGVRVAQRRALRRTV